MPGEPPPESGNPSPPARLRVLFLCTGNSCRSQMAEGWARHLHGDRIDARSAGTDPHGLDPRAVKIMAEAGVDISGHKSKGVDVFREQHIDLVVTVCDSARETCPVFPAAARTLHVGFEDPPRLAAEASGPDAAREAYRRVRDEIRAFVEALPTLMSTAPQRAP